MAVHETDQPVELVGGFSERQFDMLHSLFVLGEAIEHLLSQGIHFLRLQLLHFSLTPLDLCNNDKSILKLRHLLFEVETHPLSG